MSRVTTFTINERKNLGDYQHRECTLNIAVDETESEVAACVRGAKLASWAVNFPERETEYNKQKGLLTSEDEKVKTYAEKYVARFEALRDEIEGV